MINKLFLKKSFINIETEHGNPFEFPLFLFFVLLHILTTSLNKGQLVCLLIINRWHYVIREKHTSERVIARRIMFALSVCTSAVIMS